MPDNDWALMLLHSLTAARLLYIAPTRRSLLPLSLSTCLTRSLITSTGRCWVWCIMYMASLSHGLLSLYEEKLWGGDMSAVFVCFCSQWFGAEQMSPECGKGVLGIKNFVFALRYLMHITGTMSFLIRFTAAFLSTPPLLTSLFFLSLYEKEHVFECLL